MKKNEKKITIIAGTESTRERILRQLVPLLSDKIEIESFVTDTKDLKEIHSELVVISSPLIAAEAAPYISKNSKVLLARRALDFSSIEKLYSIPQGTEVLVVNDDLETAQDVIHLIQEVGIDHLKLIPYYPGAKISKIPSVAITPGEPQHAPAGLKQLIDISPRIIDLTTVVEILQALDLLDEKAHYVSAKFFETIVRLGKQLYLSNHEQMKANENLNKVLNQVNDGILAYTRDGRISVFNQSCEEIFRLRSTLALGKEIHTVIKEKRLLDFLMGKEQDEDILFNLGDKEFAVSRFFVEKLDSYVVTLKNTREIAEIETKIRRNLVKKGHIGKYHFSDIIHQSEPMKILIETGKKIARTELSTLIVGESGTGKELFASSIHNSSPRANGPYLAVNFSALPEELVESELFGYEEGAFTGAKKGGRMGLFEQANNGTIFLDEIGDTSLKIQARLLRVLQEKEILKIGGTEIIPVNVRVIAATNKDLMKMCQEGRFREDLYYRLKKLSLNPPPLRSRKEDIPLLVNYFLEKNRCGHLTLSEQVLSRLKAYHWPGNVRELENTVEYMLAVCEESEILTEHLPPDLAPLQECTRTIGSPEIHLDRESIRQSPELLFLLESICIRENQARSTGRRALSELSIGTATPLTEEQVRSRCEFLSSKNLIFIRKGRLGMSLTPSGKEFLKECRG